MEIVERIYKLIESNNTNANRVTKGCGLNSNIFTFWKNGRQKPSLDALIKIANYFNVSIDYLVGREQLNTSTNVNIDPISKRISQLNELQRIQVIAYLDGLQGVKSHASNINTRDLVSNALNYGINEGKVTPTQNKKIS